jgi:hypothetical protein
MLPQNGKDHDMTQAEQLVLAGEKVKHWRGKCERAASMLSKWESRLKGLQGKSQPTAKSLPPVMLVAATGEPNGKVLPLKPAKGKKPPKRTDTAGTTRNPPAISAGGFFLEHMKGVQLPCTFLVNVEFCLSSNTR